MIDVKDMREAYERFEINDVAWIKIGYNPADVLTKKKENGVLSKILDNGIVRHPMGQWVERDDDSRKPTFVLNQI